jgi:hypothetical protein
MKKYITPTFFILLVLFAALSMAGQSEYDRTDWTHWADLDGDCQNERAETLIRYSTTPVTFRTPNNCVVHTGTWHCPFTGKTFRSAYQLDIDHIVPLKNAFKSGAHTWSKAEKKRFANDQENLIPVYFITNRSKGSRGPEEWVPPNQEFSQKYALKWIYIKEKYRLEYTMEELSALGLLLIPQEGK